LDSDEENYQMSGNIPVLFVKGDSLVEAWEKSVISVYNDGCDIKTEYDKADDPPSKDCSMTICSPGR
jgi:thymidylate synthase